jgi:hypothetical protein
MEILRATTSSQVLHEFYWSLEDQIKRFTQEYMTTGVYVLS